MAARRVDKEAWRGRAAALVGRLGVTVRLDWRVRASPKNLFKKLRLGISSELLCDVL